MKYFSMTTVAACAALLTACGDGGPSTPTPTAPVAYTAKVVPEVRTTGFSSFYTSDATYRTIVDVAISSVKDAMTDLSTKITFPSTVPMVFSGCGYMNAFWAKDVGSIHAALKKQTPSFDPVARFGPDVTTSNVTVMCHELSETTVLKFLPTYNTDAAYLNQIKTSFGLGASPTTGDLVTAGLFSATVFMMQVLLHEVGHGVDYNLLGDDAAKTKKLSFKYPVVNTCSSATCDTVAEDFGDLFSAYAVSEAIRADMASAKKTAASIYVAALRTALFNWSSVLGAGGDVAHGFTAKRQANMTCTVYGSSADIRTADAANGNLLLNDLKTYGLTAADCVDKYTFNAAQMKSYLSTNVKF